MTALPPRSAMRAVSEQMHALLGEADATDAAEAVFGNLHVERRMKATIVDGRWVERAMFVTVDGFGRVLSEHAAPNFTGEVQ